MPVPEHFLLDRDRFARALQDARATAEIRASRRHPLNAAVAAFFQSAVDAGAIAGPRGVRPDMHAVGTEDLVVAVGAVGDGGRLRACQHQACTVPFNVNEVLSVMARGFTPACHVVERLLQRADELTWPFRAMQRRSSQLRAPHLALLVAEDDDRESGEIAIPFPGGRTLRTNAGVDGDVWIGADHLRVCEPDGREVAAWERIEWQEDPVVIAAVLTSALGVPGLQESPSIARDPLRAVLVVDRDLGAELAIPFPGGRTLRTDARAADRCGVGGHYLRVCDAHGTQIGFWAHPQWRQQPVATIGAVLGCALGLDVDAQAS